MDTQILTLFGDEDFQSLPPQKKQSKKEPEEAKDSEVNTEEPAKELPVAHKTSGSLSYDAPAIADKKREFVIGNYHVEPLTMSNEIATENDNETVQSLTPDNTIIEEKEEVADEKLSNEYSGQASLEKDTIEDAPEPTASKTQQDDATALDAEMRIAMLQNDYAGYFYKENAAAPATSTQKSAIVFEGVVAPKKNQEKPGDIKPVPEIVEEEIEEENLEIIEPLPEFQLESRYYSIGEVAKLFNVNNSHIRFWTNEFKLKPRTTRKGDRLYNAEDIATLRLIHHLVKEKRHTIKGAKEKMKQKETVEVNLDLSESLIKLKDMLTEMKNQL